MFLHWKRFSSRWLREMHPPTSVCVLLFNMRNRVAHKLASGCHSVSPALVKSEEGVAPNYFHFFLLLHSAWMKRSPPPSTAYRGREGDLPF